jgi:capsular polysaccharide export protein
LYGTGGQGSRDTVGRFLFLQGPPGRFARHLGTALQASGCYVRRVNFCTSDWLYWGGRDAIAFRGRARAWEAFLENLIRREKIDCIVYFADRLPYHVAAQRVARRMNIQAVSYEFGYIRPDWIIVEHGGQSLFSHVPADLATIRKLAAEVPAPDLKPRTTFGFATQAFHEVTFNLTNFFLFWPFPFYDTDRAHNPLVEYLSYILRLMRARRNRLPAEQTVRDLVSGKTPYFVVALQMQGDYQIRDNSPYRTLEEFISEVVTSFARSGPPDAKLVFKLHPLDNGLVDLEGHVRRASAMAGVGDRIVFIDGGDLNPLVRHARGCVVINSTVGLIALRLGVPVKTMGIAVYDMPGLTNQGPLDLFWSDPGAVAATDVAALVRVLAACVHVKGDFYSREGRATAIAAFAQRLCNGQVNGQGCFVDPPPRIARALDQGISVDPDQVPGAGQPNIAAPETC